jgi:outer membrane protein TolC
MQEMEDLLAMLRELGVASDAERQRMSAAHPTERLANESYCLGAESYLEVVTSQTAALQASQNVVELDTR